jgi:hypothetical protein
MQIRNKLIAGGAAVLIGAAGLVALTGAAAPADVQVVQLSPAEAWQLQQRMEQQLKNSVGGKQTGPNTVSYYDGSIIVTLVLPGETVARPLNNDFEVQASLCAAQNVCIYDFTNFTGDNATRVQKFACQEIRLIDLGFLNRVSAVHNNQTTNTQTILLDDRRHVVNANRAPSKINDLGDDAGNNADWWITC